MMSSLEYNLNPLSWPLEYQLFVSALTGFENEEVPYNTVCSSVFRDEKLYKGSQNVKTVIMERRFNIY